MEAIELVLLGLCVVVACLVGIIVRLQMQDKELQRIGKQLQRISKRLPTSDEGIASTEDKDG